MRTFVKYHNQCRVMHDKKDSEWSDTCSGHATYEKALTCALVQQAAWDKAPVNTQLMDADTHAIVGAFSDLYKLAGAKMQLRIIRRTVSEEVLDA